MDKKKIIKICLFNGFIVLSIVIIFSKGILAFSPFSENTLISAASITILIMTVILFLFGNYTLFKSLFRQNTYIMDELNKPEEFADALRIHKDKEAFANDIYDIIEQIDTLNRKKKTLDTVLYQKFEDEAEEFQSLIQVVEDTSLLLYENIKRILSRIEIFDQEEYEKLCRKNATTEIEHAKIQIFQEHLAYVKEYKQKNDAILLQFDNLLIEVSKLGEKDTGGTEKFQEIAQAMKKLRTNNDELSELEQKYNAER